MGAIDRQATARWPLGAWIAASIALAWPSTSRADPSRPGLLDAITKKARGEIAFYGDTDSVQVFTSAWKATVDNPVSGWSANGSYLVDVVSAASVDIVSTASSHWTEVRQAGTLGANYKPGAIGVGITGAVSREPDYLSLSAGGRLSFDVHDKTVLPTVGYSYGHDTAGRTGTPFSVYSLDLTRHAFDLGSEFVLDRSTTLSLNASFLLERGDQEKPYRFLPLFSPAVAKAIEPGASIALVNNERLPGRIAEHLPNRRNRFALSGRFARRLARATFIVNERVYADDWGLKASTTDMHLVFDVGGRLEIAPHFRGHVQSSVDFWRLAYSAVVSTDGVLDVPLYRTGDRELSALSSGTLGIGFRYRVLPLATPWSLVVGLRSEVMATIFHDALFVRDRKAYLNAVDAEIEF